jgi:predicted ATPase
VCDLVGAAAGHQLDLNARQFALAVGREAAGNPYFIVEILRDLAERGAVTRSPNGRWSTEPNWHISLPSSVRDVILQRVQRLGNPVMRSLSAAAVLGVEFDPLLVAEVVGAAVDDVVEAMDIAAAAAMVAESPTVSGWLTFTHGLAQRTLYEQLGLLRRQQLHRMVAESLEAQVAAHPSRRSALAAGLARHWLAGGRIESLPKAFHWSVEAGRAALEGVGAEEAEQWLEQALELLGGLPEAGPVERAQTLLLLGIAQRQAGNPAFRETLLEAASVAHAQQLPELLVAAVLANSRGIQSSTGGGDQARLAMVDVAIDASAAKPADRARLLALSALERLHVASFEQRLALVEEAVHLARSSGDEATLANVLTASSRPRARARRTSSGRPRAHSGPRNGST